MRATYDQRVIRRPFSRVPIARTGYDRSVSSGMGVWDTAVAVAVVLLVTELNVTGWLLIFWMVAWGLIMARRRGHRYRVCESIGHVPYRPYDAVDVVFCARCDVQLRDDEWQLSAPEAPSPGIASAVADAVTEVDAARAGDEPPQAAYSDRR